MLTASISLQSFKCCLEPILIYVKKTLTGNDVMKVGVCGGICQKWVFLERFVKTNRILAGSYSAKF